MNNRGYMLYELIIAFILTTIISIFLLSTAFKLNDRNQELIVSSKISVLQEDFTSRFYKDARGHMSTYFVGAIGDANGEYCSFYMDDQEVRFGIDKNSRTIYYGDYESKLPDGVNPVSINCGSTYSGMGYENSIFHNIREGNKNSAITINVRLEDVVTNKDYNINILYLYQDTNVKYSG